MNPRKKTEIRRTFQAFLMELLVYAVLVTGYFFPVLHFLGGWLMRFDCTTSTLMRLSRFFSSSVRQSSSNR